jgi:hypothetical protein
MVRPLTGPRELFRRLNENNEARRRRTNEVREMGGLEPVEDTPTLNWNTLGVDTIGYANYITGHDMRDYQRQLLERLTDETRVTFMGGLTRGPIHNNTIYNRDALERATQQYRENLENGLARQLRDLWLDAEHEFEGFQPQPYRTAFAPRETWGYINGAVPSLNPCNEIMSDEIYNNELKVKFKEMAGEKLQSNDDFAFLLNKD